MDLLRHYKASLELLDAKVVWSAAISAVLLTFVSLMDLIGIALIFPIAKLLSGDQEFLNTEIVKYVIDIFNISDPIIMAGGLTFAFLTLLILKGILSVAIIYWTTKKIIMAECRFAWRLYRAYIFAPIKYHQQHNSAEFIRNINQSVVYLFRTTLLQSVQMAANIFLFLGVLALLIYTDPIAAFTCLFILGLGGIAYSKAVSSKISRMASHMADLNLENYKVMRESLDSIYDIKVLNKYSYFLNKFEDIRRSLSVYSYHYQVLNILPKYIFENIVGILLASLIAIMINNNVKGEDVLAILALYGVAAMRMMPMISSVVSTTNGVRSAIPFIEHLRVEIDNFEECVTLDGHLPDLSASIQEPDQGYTPRESIQFENISHHFEGGSIAVQDVSFKIIKGTSIGLVGRSGSGKTTLVNILLGLIRPTSGRILFDGIERDIEIPPIHNSIGYVPQTIHLLDASILENVAFGNEPTKINEGKCWDVLKMAQLDEFVMSLPQSIHTKVGEKGVRLSGGQRQRIGLARTLYNDPEILVFDEATSSLDVETETNISRIIHDLKGSKTIIIIAHRLSTVKECDQIFFMQNGRIADSGTFSELKRDNEDFKKMTEYASLQD